MDFLLSEALFKHKAKVINICNPPQFTNAQGARFVGISKYHDTTVNPAKYSYLAIAAEKILSLGDVVAYEAENGVFGEMHSSTGIIRFFCDGKAISSDVELYSVYKLIPLLLYYMKNNITIKGEEYIELRSAFNNIKTHMGSSEANENVLLLCDSFYFRVAKNLPAIMTDTDFVIEPMLAGIRSGEFTRMDVLDGIEVPLPTFDVTESSVKPASKKSTTDVVGDARDGKFKIPYTWDEGAKSKIAKNKVLDAFISSESFEDVLSYCYGSLMEIIPRMDCGMSNHEAIGDDILNLTLFGDPSGGKTTIANALGEALGLPVYTVSQSKYSEEDTYWGKTTVAEGNFTTVPTPFVEAFTNGGIAVLEEVNLVDPGVTMGALGNAIWSPFILMKDGYTPVERHPLCIVIGTKNIGTFGSRDVNEAFNNRFVQSYEIEEPTREQFIRFLNLHDADEKRCAWVYDAYMRVCNYLKSPDVNAEDILKNISFRSCLGALKGMRFGQDPKRALKNAITGKITEIDKDLGHAVYTNSILSMPDLR